MKKIHHSTDGVVVKNTMLVGYMHDMFDDQML